MDPIKLLKADQTRSRPLGQTRGDDRTGRGHQDRRTGRPERDARCPRNDRGGDDPALKEFAKTKDIALEAYEEHHVVDMVMAELEATPVSDETWAAKLTVAKENLEHHIEEEENEMFKQARQVMDDAQLEELGDRMTTRKEELSR